MRIWGIAALAAVALTSFGAENVAPTKTELEEMYNKAFRDFEANNFQQALKELDAIDARQPDVAASQNLRGVILMRQGIYDKAEAALLEAARIDPKFWNARFNLAEIPFLQKDWTEARNRFQKLLSSSQSDLASEAVQLIQYKILLTYLLEGKENMVDSIQAKLELSPSTPAVDYVKAAVALQHKNEKEAKDWIAVAEKNFSPQLNKLFVESFYEVGWLARPTGEGRASLPLATAAERKEKAKATARAKFEQAQQALRQRDLAAARKLVDEADQAEPNQAATLNLRGEILMEQKEFDQAEAAFKKAARLDPKFREAQFNLAQVPFKRKDYAKARERFETLFEQTPGGDKNQAAELIKFKIYMTLLLEGKDSRAQSMMEQFQFTGDTPALYYAQAAWEFKHNNGDKAADWVASAKKIYSQALNNIFADALYDVGWIQAPQVAAAPAVDAGSLVASQTETGTAPAIEPSPIPASVAGANKQEETTTAESVAAAASVVNPASTGIQPTTEPPGASRSGQTVATATSAQPEQRSSAPQTAAAGASLPLTAAASPAPSQPSQPPRVTTAPSPAAIAKQTANRLASVTRTNVAAWSTSLRPWLFGGLLLAGIFFLAWVIVPRLSRRYAFDVSNRWQAKSVGGQGSLKPAPAEKNVPSRNGLFGGPRQVSIQLKAARPSVRRTVLGFAKSAPISHSIANPETQMSGATSYDAAGTDRDFTPIGELDSFFESSVGRVIEQTPQEPLPVLHETSEVNAISAAHELDDVSSRITEESLPAGEQAAIASVVSTAPESALGAPEQPAHTEGIFDIEVPVTDTTRESTPVVEPIEEETGASDDWADQSESSPPETIAEPSPDFATRISTEPVFPKTTPPSAMPQPTQIPTAPVTKPQPPSPTPAPPKPQPIPTIQTPVQITFFFEIAAMQLTPSFRMGVLRVRPTSKLVTMRLGSQQPQAAMNLQVAFEIAKIQPAGVALGTIRLTPTQQQRPTASGSPSFAVAGLQVMPNTDTAPVQFTPSQGQAAVSVTVGCQISTVEFSPSLEIASIILNSSAKQVVVQLPGAVPGSAEGAPVFEITNLQVSESGDNVGMMQLNLLGPGAKRG